MKQNDNHSAPDFTDSTQIAHIVKKKPVLGVLVYYSTFSMLIFSGITMIHLYPFTAAAKAMPIPEINRHIRIQTDIIHVLIIKNIRHIR